MKQSYVVVFEQTPNNYCAYVPDLPGCVSAHKTWDGIQSMIKEAIEFHIEGLQLDGTRSRRRKCRWMKRWPTTVPSRTTTAGTSPCPTTWRMRTPPPSWRLRSMWKGFPWWRAACSRRHSPSPHPHPDLTRETPLRILGSLGSRTKVSARSSVLTPADSRSRYRGTRGRSWILERGFSRYGRPHYTDSGFYARRFFIPHSFAGTMLCLLPDL